MLPHTPVRCPPPVGAGQNTSWIENTHRVFNSLCVRLIGIRHSREHCPASRGVRRSVHDPTAQFEVDFRNTTHIGGTLDGDDDARG